MSEDTNLTIASEDVPFTKPNTKSFIVCTILLIVILQLYKKLKSTFRTYSEYEKSRIPGLEALPKIKNFLPFKLIGPIPYLWPISRALQFGFRCSIDLGDMFRTELLGQDFVIFNSGPTIQTLLKSGDFGHVHKAPLAYGPMKPFITNGLLVSDGPFWQKQRKILMKSQSYQNLKSYMEMLNRHSIKLMTNFENRFTDGKTQTISDLINVSFLENTCEMITGENLDRSEELLHYHKNFSFWKDTLPFRVLNPFLLWDPLWRLHPRCRKHEDACQQLSDFARRKIGEARQKRVNGATIDTASEFQSLLDDMLDADMNETQLVDEINTVMFGGHETGASALHCLIFALGLNPKVQEEARKEVDELFANSTFVKDGQITFDACQGRLKYVERCILEGLRLFPPAFMILRELLTPLNVEFGDKDLQLPTGTNCIISPFCVHRLERFYPNPEKFDPDRFLPDEVKKRHTYTYIPFSSGPRGCLGPKLAILELKTMLSHILRNFELSTEDRMEDVVWLPYTTLTPEKDFRFRFTKRRNDENVMT